MMHFMSGFQRLVAAPVDASTDSQDEASSVASLRITAEGLIPEHVSNLLDLAPTSAAARGGVMEVTSTGKVVRAPTGTWYRDTANDDERSAGEQLAELVKHALPATAELKAIYHDIKLDFVVVSTGAPERWRMAILSDQRLHSALVAAMLIGSVSLSMPEDAMELRLHADASEG